MLGVPSVLSHSSLLQLAQTLPALASEVAVFLLSLSSFSFFSLFLSSSPPPSLFPLLHIPSQKTLDPWTLVTKSKAEGLYLWEVLLSIGRDRNSSHYVHLSSHEVIHLPAAFIWLPEHGNTFIRVNF